LLPLVVGVNGAARAGGFEIALAADLVVAATSATFGLLEAQHRHHRRRRRSSAARAINRPAAANQMLLAGGVIHAERAYALGMVGTLVTNNELAAEAIATAHRVAAASPVAVRITRDVVFEAICASAEGTRAANARAVERITASADFAEGIATFAERRAPVWH
jgi:enoyl-CoA hydratase